MDTPITPMDAPCSVLGTQHRCPHVTQGRAGPHQPHSTSAVPLCQNLPSPSHPSPVNFPACSNLTQKFPPSPCPGAPSRHVCGLPGAGTDKLTPLRRSEMKNGIAVTNMCQHSPGAGSSLPCPEPPALSSLGQGQPRARALISLQKCYLASFASFTLHSLVLFILGLLEMFSS